MTPLAAYMKAKRLNDDKLATLVGRERSTITKLRLGQARPSLELAIKIAALSEGAVPAAAYPEPKRPAKQVAA